MEKNAIISVYDKTGIAEFARELVFLGWRIFSSGGTAKVLGEAGIQATDIVKLTGFPPILDHRVVTLAPQIHGGLLATEKHREELARLGFPWIDLVCVDLYPLKEEIVRPGATRESVIEKTDIGGPALIRSAAKGRRIIIADLQDRKKVIEWLKDNEPRGEEFRNMLASKAEAVVADYCLSSARFHSGSAFDGVIGREIIPCKYGENAWQTPAGLFGKETSDSLSLQNFKLAEGTAPSYNNLCDIDRMLHVITHIAASNERNGRNFPCISVGVKHGNPCGASVAANPADALCNMIDGDPLALFGGLVMVNFSVLKEEAEILRQWNMPEGAKRLLDGIAAPFFSEDAKIELGRKGGKCRLMENPALVNLGESSLDSAPRFRYARGGFLRQPNYTFVADFKDTDIEIVGATRGEPQETDLLLAWAIGSASNSNTITLVKNKILIGNGVGQQDRVGAATLAVMRARRSGHDTNGAVAYSDSFFPFPDGPHVLIDAGIKAIFTSKGSVNDELIREVCRKAGVVLYFLPDQKCRGFFGH